MATKTKRTPKASANGKPPSPAGEVMTLAEAAAFLRVPEDGLRVDATAGRVPGRLVAGEWRFAKVNLVAWLSHSTKASLEDSWSPEAEQEAEAEIARLSAARRALGTVGDTQAKEVA